MLRLSLFRGRHMLAVLASLPFTFLNSYQQALFVYNSNSSLCVHNRRLDFLLFLTQLDASPLAVLWSSYAWRACFLFLFSSSFIRKHSLYIIQTAPCVYTIAVWIIYKIVQAYDYVSGIRVRTLAHSSSL